MEKPDEIFDNVKYLTDDDYQQKTFLTRNYAMGLLQWVLKDCCAF